MARKRRGRPASADPVKRTPRPSPTEAAWRRRGGPPLPRSGGGRPADCLSVQQRRRRRFGRKDAPCRQSPGAGNGLNTQFCPIPADSGPLRLNAVFWIGRDQSFLPMNEVANRLMGSRPSPSSLVRCLVRLGRPALPRRASRRPCPARAAASGPGRSTCWPTTALAARAATSPVSAASSSSSWRSGEPSGPPAVQGLNRHGGRVLPWVESRLRGEWAPPGAADGLGRRPKRPAAPSSARPFPWTPRRVAPFLPAHGPPCPGQRCFWLTWAGNRLGAGVHAPKRKTRPGLVRAKKPNGLSSSPKP